MSADPIRGHFEALAAEAHGLRCRHEAGGMSPAEEQEFYTRMAEINGAMQLIEAIIMTRVPRRRHLSLVGGDDA